MYLINWSVSGILLITWSGEKKQAPTSSALYQSLWIVLHRLKSIIALPDTCSTFWLDHSFQDEAGLKQPFKYVKVEIFNTKYKSWTVLYIYDTHTPPHRHKMLWNESQFASKWFPLPENNRVFTLPLIQAPFFHPVFVYPCCLAKALLESLLIAVWQGGWVANQPRGGSVVCCLWLQSLQMAE